MAELFVGVDTGGTFTDLVLLQEGEIRVHKVLSTPDDPSQAILQGLSDLGVRESLSTLVHGSTVATNAVLEHKGVRTGLITTAGFRDVLEIGRQTRPKLYDLKVQKEPPLVPRSLRLEVVERLNAYIGPLVERYLAKPEEVLPRNIPFRIMQSNGGSISSATASREAARTLLSGPAAGVVGAAFVAEASGFKHAITLDMGGTSTDVALIDGTIT